MPLKAVGSMEKGQRECYLGLDRSEEKARIPVYNRYALSPGWRLESAALIEENDTTIFIPPGVHVEVAPSLDLIAHWRR